MPFLVLLVQTENHGIHHLPHRNDLRRVFDVLRPAHFGNMNKPFDPFFNFHKRAVVSERYDLADHFRSDGIFRFDILPRMRLQLLVAERNTFLLLVEVEHDDIDLLIQLHDFGRMIDAAPGQVGDVH